MYSCYCPTHSVTLHDMNGEPAIKRLLKDLSERASTLSTVQEDKTLTYYRFKSSPPEV